MGAWGQRADGFILRATMINVCKCRSYIIIIVSVCCDLSRVSFIAQTPKVLFIVFPIEINGFHIDNKYIFIKIYVKSIINKTFRFNHFLSTEKGKSL